LIFNAIFNVLIVGVLINSKDIFDVLISMFWSTKKTISTFWNFWPVDVLKFDVPTPSQKKHIACGLIHFKLYQKWFILLFIYGSVLAFILSPVGLSPQLGTFTINLYHCEICKRILSVKNRMTSLINTIG
jgi:hypothetical protein